MKLGTYKCHLLTSGHEYEYQGVQIGKDMVWEENEFKVLGTVIDSELRGESHIDFCTLCHNDARVCRLIANGVLKKGAVIEFQSS